MNARQLGLLLHCVHAGAQFHRARRRDDAENTPYINGSFLRAQELWAGGERDLYSLCDVMLEGTGMTAAALDADYVLVGDDCTYSDDDVAGVLDALVCASVKHRDQARKDAARTPYIIHPIEVLHVVYQIGGVRDLVSLLACILHDTVEDTDTTFDELSVRFGDDLAGVVREVTDDKSLPKAERKRLQVEHASHKSDRAKTVKYGDKSANVADVRRAEDWSAQRMRDYVSWGARIVRQFKGLNPRLDAHFEHVSAEVLAALPVETAA